MMRLLAACFCGLLFKGGVYFIGKPVDINHGYVRAIQQQLLNAGSIVHATSQFCCTHGKELYNTNSPSASLVTVVRIIRRRVRVPRVAAARGRDHYGVCKTFVAAAAVTVNQQPHF